MSRLLTALEESDLLRRAGQGDAGARDALVMANQGLVYKFARRYCHVVSNCQSLEDLVQWGNVGLLRAISGWRNDAGSCRFSTYAVFWIRAYIWREGLRAGADLNRSYRSFDRAMRVRRIRSRLAHTLQRDPSVSEIAAETDLSEDFVSSVFDSVSWSMLRLDSEYQDDKDMTPLYEVIPSAHNTATEAERKIALEQVVQAVSNLKAREISILKMRFIDGLSYRNIGRELKITSQAVRNIERRALGEIRFRLKIGDLD